MNGAGREGGIGGLKYLESKTGKRERGKRRRRNKGEVKRRLRRSKM